MTEELRVEITVDYDGAGARAGGIAVEGLGDKVKEASGKFVRAAGSLRELATAQTSFVRSAKEGTLAYQNLGRDVAFAGKALDKVPSAAGKAATALTGVTRIVQDAPFGFIAIGNNISELVGQFGLLVNTSGSVGGAFKSLGRSLIGPGGVILGINLLITGITTLVQKYGSIGNAINALLFPLNEQQRLQKLVNDTLAAGEQSAQSELVTLDKLYRATQNVNVPMAERNKIVDQLQKQYPDYFGKLSNEEVLVGKAASAYNRLRDAVVASATVRGIDKELETIGGKAATLLREQKALRAENVQAIQTWRNYSAELAKVQKEATGIGAIALSERIAELQANVAGAAAAVDISTKKLRENALAQGEVRTSQEELADIQQELIAQYGAMSAGVQTVVTNGKGLKTITDILAEMRSELNAVNVQASVTGQAGKKLGEDLIRVYERAVGELAQLKVDPNSPILAGLRKEVEEIQKFIAPNKFKAPPVTIPIGVDTGSLPEAAATAIKGLDDAFRPQLNVFTKSINDIVANNLVSGIASISEAIGEAVATGNVSGVLKAFVGSIANFLSELGATLIATGVGIEAFKKSLNSLQGIPAIVAGAGLIAAAGAFRAVASSFATGGTAFGGTSGGQLAWVGDNPERKEHILSDHQLENIAGSGRGFEDGYVISVTRGQDILHIYQTAQSAQRRSRG